MEPNPVEYTVTPADLRNLLAGEGGVDLRTTSVNGKPAMRIVGVTAGTTAARLGANNDDTIETINDMPLDSIAAAYRAGDAAARAKRIVIRGTRSGAPYITVLVVEA